MVNFRQILDFLSILVLLMRFVLKSHVSISAVNFSTNRIAGNFCLPALPEMSALCISSLSNLGHEARNYPKRAKQLEI